VPVPCWPSAARTALRATGSQGAARPWSKQLDRLSTCRCAADRRQCGPFEVISPDDVFSGAKAAAALLAAGLAWRQGVDSSRPCSRVAGQPAVLRYLAVVLNRQGILPAAGRGKALLLAWTQRSVVAASAWRLARLPGLAKGSRACG